MRSALLSRTGVLPVILLELCADPRKEAAHTEERNEHQSESHLKDGSFNGRAARSEKNREKKDNSEEERTKHINSGLKFLHSPLLRLI